jgi:hypothetical protein
MRGPRYDWATHGLIGSKAATQGVRLHLRGVVGVYTDVPPPNLNADKGLIKGDAELGEIDYCFAAVRSDPADEHRSRQSRENQCYPHGAPVQPAIRTQIGVAAEVPILRVTVQ